MARKKPQEATQGSRRKKAGEVEVWKPLKRGDRIEGTYKQKFTHEGEYGSSTGYKILTGDGMRLIWGTGRLNVLFDEIPEESYVWITYLGKVKNSKSKFANEPHDWDVEYETSE